MRSSLARSVAAVATAAILATALSGCGWWAPRSLPVVGGATDFVGDWENQGTGGDARLTFRSDGSVGLRDLPAALFSTPVAGNGSDCDDVLAGSDDRVSGEGSWWWAEGTGTVTVAFGESDFFLLPSGFFSLDRLDVLCNGIDSAAAFSFVPVDPPSERGIERIPPSVSID